MLALEPDEILALEEDAAARDPGRWPQDLHDGVRDGRLAAARLARQADDLTGVDRQVDPVDGAHETVADAVLDGEAAELDERLALRCCRRNRRHRLDDADHVAPLQKPASPAHPLGAQPRVADLVDACEHERQPEDRDADREPGKHERPPLALQYARVDRRPVERDAPARLLQVAEAKELEARGDEDRDVEDEHERRRDAADHVGQELAEDDAPRRLSGHLRREDEVAVLQGQSLGAQDPSLERPQREPDHEGHRQQAALVQERGDVDEQRNRRNDEEDVRDETQDVVDEAADVRGEEAERGREDRGDRTGSGADQERAPCSPRDLREDVGALVGRAEQVMERRRLACVERARTPSPCSRG